MAKGNLFLGTAAGSVGDVTMYRRDGQQVSRVRVRKVKNPNTNAQLFTRAIMATVMQAYSAGKAIFDHSFEGKSVPGGSQREFMKRNAKLLRQTIANDIANALEGGETAGVVVARGATSPVPFTYIVSDGKLVQNLFSMGTDPDAQHKVVTRMANPATGTTTLGAYVAENNLSAGDIFTIVAFGINYESGWSIDSVNYSRQYPARFGFIRLTVKDDIDSTKSLSTATFGDLFIQDTAGTTIPDSQLLSSIFASEDGGLNIDQVVPSALAGCMGVIRSREDSGARSKCQLVGPFDEGNLPWGISTDNILTAWNPKTATIGDSDLILEGGDV